ncbi:dienelactone hydrolase family protein [Limibaculum sp. FT325]|uniref:alpha/beta hydrolase n=1 Tax=Thermohalobaculum sediminis TaxID=2939436 RepID=UPI0020BE77BE|nr:dienelactone hydrolase family protein [Limibaculum sediminis]MCL5778628.1 dienelactone hydrolase family protein [Limibaculum sediminis]
MTTAQPTLTGPRHAPRSGRTKSLVILLHGYGADGNDLIGLADPLSSYMPDTAFRAPNAPERCRVNPMGYQWFPISWIDGSPESEMQAGFTRAAGVLDAYITAAMAEEGVEPHETALVGFSQGTMMSLHVAPRREAALAGVVGFSGRLNAPERLAAEARVKPPVLLIHGDRDEVIPVGALREAHDALAAAGFPVAAHVSRGTGHGIAPDGLGLALGFLMDRFGIERPVEA